MCKKNPGIFFTHFDKQPKNDDLSKCVKKILGFFYTFLFFGQKQECVKKIPGFFLHILVFGLKTGMCKKNPRIFFTHFYKNSYFSKNIFEKQIIGTCHWCTEIFR